MTALPDMPALDCPDCGAKLVLQVMPKAWQKRGGKREWVYLCENRPDCRGLCSAHPNGTPTGPPANAETRRARMKLHNDAFDPLWKTAWMMYAKEGTQVSPAELNNIARRRAYLYLADQLGIPFDDCHIGMFDLETCRRAWVVCRATAPEAIRAWAKQRKAAA